MLERLIQPETFWGAVFSTVVGTGIVGVVGALYVLGHRLWRRYRLFDARFQPPPLATASEADFTTGYYRETVHENTDRICFGVYARHENVRFASLDLRPVKRGWLGWHNAEDGQVEFLDLWCRQLEHVRRNYDMGHLFNPWKNGVGGFTCLVHHSGFLLERGCAVWFEVRIRAVNGWRGAVSFRGRSMAGEEFYCRRHLKIIGDHNMVT